MSRVAKQQYLHYFLFLQKQVIGHRLIQANDSRLRHGDNCPDEIVPVQESRLTMRNNEEAASLLPSDTLQFTEENFSYLPEQVNMIDLNFERESVEVNVAITADVIDTRSTSESCSKQSSCEVALSDPTESRLQENLTPIYQNSIARSTNDLGDLEQILDCSSSKIAAHTRVGSEDSAFCDGSTSRPFRNSDGMMRVCNVSTDSDQSADEGYIKLPIQNCE